MTDIECLELLRVAALDEEIHPGPVFRAAISHAISRLDALTKDEPWEIVNRQDNDIDRLKADIVALTRERDVFLSRIDALSTRVKDASSGPQVMIEADPHVVNRKMMLMVMAARVARYPDTMKRERYLANGILWLLEGDNIIAPELIAPGPQESVREVCLWRFLPGAADGSYGTTCGYVGATSADLSARCPGCGKPIEGWKP